MKLRKKYHHDFVRIIRKANKMLMEDTVFDGRYYMTLMRYNFYDFSDGSGGELIAIVRMHDKASGYYCDYRIKYAPWIATFYWHFNMDIINDFLVNKMNWMKERDGKTYYHIPMDTSWDGRWNFYIAKKYFEKTEN